ncbi:unnamed protein product [Phytophthora fragariaefolia]|uniref:Unnamed protein product n=1 Tax=Phytophthora fragariaefolia TaxID=1490495 RepID=A0A9W7CQW7_9STRA|nr:unnamed protein product [Phytophthora fragariaefolia]
MGTPNEEQPKYPAYLRSFRPMLQVPGTCPARHAVDQDVSPSDDSSSLWNPKSPSLDRASRSQDPDATPLFNDERAAAKRSTWRSSIQEPSHSEKAYVFQADETAKDPDTKRY